MPSPRYTYDINQVELTHVQSGDMDNNVYYSYFNGNQQAKEQTLKMLLKSKSALTTIVDTIFNENISDDALRKITTALTFYDAIINITQSSSPVKSVDDLYFALLVNYNCSKGVSRNRIKSYSALADIHESGISEENGLDYREYIINSTDGNFDNDYVAITMDTTKNYSCKMVLNIPIIKLRLGRFRFATERIPAYMTFHGDSDDTQLTVPPNIWLEMVREGVGNRITPKFSKLESRSLQKVVDSDPRFIDDIMAQNDFKSVMNFINAYDIEVNDSGEIVINNTEELPDITVNRGLEWVPKSGGRYVLSSYNFYVAKLTGSAIHILQEA